MTKKTPSYEIKVHVHDVDGSWFRRLELSSPVVPVVGDVLMLPDLSGRFVVTKRRIYLDEEPSFVSVDVKKDR